MLAWICSGMAIRCLGHGQGPSARTAQYPELGAMATSNYLSLASGRRKAGRGLQGGSMRSLAVGLTAIQARGACVWKGVLTAHGSRSGRNNRNFRNRADPSFNGGPSRAIIWRKFDRLVRTKSNGIEKLAGPERTVTSGPSFMACAGMRLYQNAAGPWDQDGLSVFGPVY